MSSPTDAVLGVNIGTCSSKGVRVPPTSDHVDSRSARTDKELEHKARSPQPDLPAHAAIEPYGKRPITRYGERRGGSRHTAVASHTVPSAQRPGTKAHLRTRRMKTGHNGGECIPFCPWGGRPNALDYVGQCGAQSRHLQCMGSPIPTSLLTSERDGVIKHTSPATHCRGGDEASRYLLVRKRSLITSRGPGT